MYVPTHTPDYSKYDYIPDAAYPNIVIASAKDIPENERRGLDTVPEPLQKVLCTIARKYAGHKFIGTHRRYNNVVDTFYVFNGNDCLGAMDAYLARRRGGMDSVRFMSGRVTGRRGEVRTSLQDKAVKMFGTLFGGLTVLERWDLGREAIQSSLGSSLNSAGTNERLTYRNIYTLMQEYVARKIQEDSAFRSDLIGLGATDELLDALPEQMALRRTIDGMQSTLRNGGSVIVVLHGDSYLVKSADDVGSEILTGYYTDTLPANIKTSIGMLKLIEDDQCITGVGYRESATTFLVLTDSNPEQQP